MKLYPRNKFKRNNSRRINVKATRPGFSIQANTLSYRVHDENYLSITLANNTTQKPQPTSQPTKQRMHDVILRQ